MASTDIDDIDSYSTPLKQASNGLKIHESDDRHPTHDNISPSPVINFEDTSSQSSLPMTNNSTLSRLTIDENDIDGESPSLNDDLYDTRSSLAVTSPHPAHSNNQHHLPRPNVTKHRHNLSFSSSSIMTRHSFEDTSSISLGENKVSAVSISPLGQNSIFEIVSGADKLRKKQGKVWLSINNGTTKISVRGPTTNDIPPVHLSKLEKVSNADLKKYARKVHVEYKDFYNSNRQLTQATLNSLLQETVNDNNNNDNTSKQLEEDLKKIPRFYFDEDFALDDPRIFKKMTENSDILLKNNDQDKDNSKALANNNLLQEKLSWYLDTVEIHLINEISKSSNSFFSALDDLKKITTESSQLGSSLGEVDEKLSSLDTERASTAINLMTKFKKRQNIILLENSLIQLKLAMKLPDFAEDFFYKNQLSISLQFIDLYYEVISGNNDNEYVKILTGEKFKIYDIHDLPALENLNKMVYKLREDIGQSYVNLFVDSLLSDLRSHYENTSQQDALDRISFSVSRESRHRSKIAVDAKSINNSYQELSDNFTHEIPNLLVGLLRSQTLIPAFQIYQQKLIPEVKNIIRDSLPNTMIINDQESTTSSSRPASSTAGGGGGGAPSSRLGSDLRSMTPKEFEDMLVEIYTKMAECLRRLTIQQKFLLNLALDLISQAQDPMYDQDPEIIMKLDLSQTINQCIDKIQERMSKILTVRRDQTIKLTVPFFLKFYSINNLFSHECESISGSTTAVFIRDATQHYTKQYIHNFPNLQLRFLNDCLEREIWKDVPLPMNLQNFTNEIVESAQDDPVAWLDSVKWINVTSKDDNNATAPILKSDANESAHTAETERKTIIIDQKSFIVPSIAIQIVQMFKDFLLLKTIFPQNSIQLQQSFIDLLLKINDKIKQQVLGANVKKTTSLKHITSKHLAITTQLLAAVIALIPYAQKTFERSIKTEDHATQQFENLINEYKDHQSQIYAKLISLMNDRVQAHCKSIANIDWSDPVKEKSCHDYMENLVKETTTIARVLQRYLPELQVSLMLSQIFDNYKTHLINEYSKLQIKDSVQKAIILKDIDYFRVNLSDLVGYGQSGQMIWETVNNLEEKEV